MNASGQHIITRLTQNFGMRVPIVSAPMAGAAPGLLAAAVSEPGAWVLLVGDIVTLTSRQHLKKLPRQMLALVSSLGNWQNDLRSCTKHWRTNPRL